MTFLHNFSKETIVILQSLYLHGLLNHFYPEFRVISNWTTLWKLSQVKEEWWLGESDMLAWFLAMLNLMLVLNYHKI
jgi:hypothetical protein